MSIQNQCQSFSQDKMDSDLLVTPQEKVRGSAFIRTEVIRIHPLYAHYGACICLQKTVAIHPIAVTVYGKTYKLSLPYTKPHH